MCSSDLAIIALVCNALLSVILVPKFGAAGAAISNAIAYFVFLVARTEVSVRFWRPIYRFKIYASVVCILMLAITTALIGNQMIVHYSVGWALLTGVLLVWFKKEIADLVTFIDQRAD